MIVIGGLEGLFVTMIPLRFLDGAAVKSWSFVAWVLVFATVTFLWWQLLFNQNAAYVAAFQQTNVQVVLVTLGLFMLTTGGIWSYFRFRPSPRRTSPEATWSPAPAPDRRSRAGIGSVATARRTMVDHAGGPHDRPRFDRPRPPPGSPWATAPPPMRRRSSAHAPRSGRTGSRPAT